MSSNSEELVTSSGGAPPVGEEAKQHAESRKRVRFDAAASATAVPAKGRKKSRGSASGKDGGDMLDEEEESGESEIVEEEAGQGFTADADDEEGNAEPDADTSSRLERRANEYGNADEVRAKVKKIARVKGEVAGVEEEFNEAGQAFEPFNLKGERDDGYYDEGGDFVWKKKTADDHDPWLAELDDMDPRSRRELQTGAARFHGAPTAGGGPGGAGRSSAAAAANDDDENDEEDGDEEEEAGEEMAPSIRAGHLQTLFSRIINDEETVAACLRRMGGKGKKGAAGAGERDVVGFNAVTEAADALMSSGLVDVYSMNRAAVRMELNDAREDAGLPPLTEAGARAAAVTGGATSDVVEAPSSAAGAAATALPLPVDPAASWRYKWSSEPGAQEFGPFSGAEMLAWRAAGYFQPSATGGGSVLIQRVGPAAAAAVATASGAAAATEEDDDDIFGGAGKYSAAGPAAVAAAWRPIAEVQF